jgi:hypothetical protein
MEIFLTSSLRYSQTIENFDNYFLKLSAVQTSSGG